jgi:hypothetical protein
MSLTARIPGKRGRLAPSGYPGPRFLHEYGALPAPVYPIDVTGGITDWQMLGNGPDPTCTVAPNGVGNCTYAARQHYRMAKAARGREQEKWETSNQLVEEYLAYDHGQDVGADMAQLLHHWFGLKMIVGYAPVDHTDPAAVDAALQAFSGVYVGVNLTDDAEQLFSDGKPWTVAHGEKPNLNEGHCILKVSADGRGTDGWISWGADQKSTTAWSAACVEEAWVIITSDDDADKLINLAALRADIQALGGDLR